MSTKWPVDEIIVDKLIATEYFMDEAGRKQIIVIFLDEANILEGARAPGPTPLRMPLPVDV